MAESPDPRAVAIWDNLAPSLVQYRQTKVVFYGYMMSVVQCGGACPVRVRSPRLSALVWRRDLATPAPWTGRPRASDLPYLKVDIARPSRECISREVAYRGRAPGDQGGSLLSDVQYRICMLSSGATRVLKVRTRMISGSDAPVGDSVWSGERACVHPRRINQITFKSFDEHVSGTT